jgi:hypothetical protein
MHAVTHTHDHVVQKSNISHTDMHFLTEIIALLNDGDVSKIVDDLNDVDLMTTRWQWQ